MADSSESQRDADRGRRRNARILLGVHLTTFTLILFGVVLRLRYLSAAGIASDPILVLLVIVGTVLLCILPPVLLVRARGARLRDAVGSSSAGCEVVYAYWSRTESPAFIDTLPPGLAARGFQVAVIAGVRGVHLSALAHGRLIDFGLLPWERVSTIEGTAKKVGIGVPVRSGVLRIRTNEPVAPYRALIELFPSKGTAADAAQRLLGSRYRDRS